MGAIQVRVRVYTANVQIEQRSDLRPHSHTGPHPDANGKTRWGDREGRLRDLLDAAAELLESGGFEALTMRQVARAAGVAPGTVYTYFDGKEDLFAALYAERLEQLDREIAPLLASASDPEEMVIIVADRYFDVYELFGRDVDVWAKMLPSAKPPTGHTLRLVAAAGALIDHIREAFERTDPGIAAADERWATLAVPFVWASLGGLADHFSGPRQLLHPHTRDELMRFSARAIVAGVRNALLAPSVPPAPSADPEGSPR